MSLASRISIWNLKCWWGNSLNSCPDSRSQEKPPLVDIRRKILSCASVITEHLIEPVGYIILAEIRSVIENSNLFNVTTLWASLGEEQSPISTKDCYCLPVNPYQCLTLAKESLDWITPKKMISSILVVVIPVVFMGVKSSERNGQFCNNLILWIVAKNTRNGTFSLAR